MNTNRSSMRTMRPVRMRTPDDMYNMNRTQVFLLKYPSIKATGYYAEEYILEGKTMLIQSKYDGPEYYPTFKVLFVVEKDNTLELDNNHGEMELVINDVYDIFTDDYINMVADDVVDDITTISRMTPNSLRYNLTFMPIDSYLTQNNMRITDKKKLIKTINQLIDKNGTQVSIPIEIWNYIMSFLVVNPYLNGGRRNRKSGTRRTRKGRRRTRRVVKKTRK